MFRTIAIIVGTTVGTLAGIAVFLRVLFRELEKMDDNNGF